MEISLTGFSLAPAAYETCHSTGLYPEARKLFHDTLNEMNELVDTGLFDQVLLNKKVYGLRGVQLDCPGANYLRLALMGLTDAVYQANVSSNYISLCRDGQWISTFYPGDALMRWIEEFDQGMHVGANREAAKFNAAILRMELEEADYGWK